ncbi:MAG: hypothetical protein IPM46_01960 [Flavobacteriales bacterium]|nr:hypothetical protein [Flavobacteriales bacterium]
MPSFRITIAAVASALAIATAGQQNDIPLQRDFYIDVERNAAKLDTIVHTGLKPVLQSRADLTHVMGHRADSARYYYWLTLKLFKEHFLVVDEGDFHLTVDPLFHQEYGNDFGDQTRYVDTTQLYFNSRGLLIAGDFGERISFQTMFHESRGAVPQFLLNQVRLTDAISGQGRVKYFDGRKLDFGWSQANLSVAATSWLNIQLGHGRHFVGHGYRSVLLSDHAPPSPYLKFSALSRSRRWQYSTWHTKLMHGLGKDDRLPTGESSEALFQWMRARFNHLSVDLGRVQLGLFEATLFRNIDEDGVRPFDPMELNPVIGINTMTFGLGHADKCLVGADLRVKVTRSAYLYGQYATDSPGRFAWQAGARAFDVGRKDLHLQLEYNSSTRFMYASDPATQSYVHAGLPLAHPLGTAFSEFVAIADAGFGRFWLQAKANLSSFERDTSAFYNHGTSLNRPDEERASPDGPDQLKLFWFDLNASYLLNPNTNLRLVLGCWRRDQPGASDGLQSTYVYAAIRTSLFNRYYDL